jgi:hypothetical protein
MNTFEQFKAQVTQHACGLGPEQLAGYWGGPPAANVFRHRMKCSGLSDPPSAGGVCGDGCIPQRHQAG